MAQDIFDTTPEDLRASMLVATSTDPEAHAKVVNLANKLQLPPELVARNPQWAQHQSDLMLDAEKLTKDYPGTSKFLSDPNRAAVSRDELIQHMAMEDTLRSAELLEPGLFGKDVRDAIAKQLRDKGHKIEIVDGSRPASEWLPSLDFTAGENVPDVIPGEVQAFQGVGGMGIPNPAQDTQDEQSQKMDQKAVQLYKTPQGFWERMITGATNLEPVPFAGAGKELVDVYALTQLANRVKDGTADDNDWIELLKYDNEIRRGTDFGGKVAAVLVNLPAFAGEIAATGGLYTAGSQAARKAGLFAAKKILNKSAREVAESAVLRGVVKTAGWVAGSAVQATVGMPHRVAVDAMQRMVPQLSSMSVSEQGELEKLVLDSEDGFASAIGKAILNQSIELGTESAGRFIGKVTGLEAMKAAVMTKWFKLHPTSGLSQFFAKLRKAKWDGVLEEFGEERLGEILRAVTGLESMKLDPEQYAVELVSFSALPMAGAAVYGPGMVRQSRQLAQRAQAQVDFVRDLGAQSSESKTRTRVPGMLGALGDLAAQNGPVERVFAPIAAWDQYFASKGIDPRQVAQETLGETESYDKAREAGHDLEIPIGAYTEKLAPTEHNEALAQVLRLGSVDAPNVVEMQAGLQATQASVEEMLKLNQDYTALSTEKQTLADEMTTLQEQVNTLQSQAEQRTARMQEIQSQLQTQAPQALQEILSGNAPAAAELQGLAQEYQSLAQQDQQAQQATARIDAITARQGEIDKEISRIEKRNAQARQSAPGQAPEVVDMANEVYTQLMATKNTSEGVARAHSNMFARMAYIMANRSGMSLQQFKDRFVTQIIGKASAAPAGVTMSQEEQQRDADYLAAVEAGDMETAQRLVDEAAKAAGYTAQVFHGTEADFTVPNMPLFLGDEATANAYAQDRAAAYGDGATPVVYRFYAKFNNTASEEDVKRVASELGLQVENDMAFSVLDPQMSPGKAQRVIEELKRQGYDSAQIDDFVAGNDTNVVQSFVAFDAQQLKSADPITRDADGNVIPLSERFDEGQNSILYQGENKTGADIAPAFENLPSYKPSKAKATVAEVDGVATLEISKDSQKDKPVPKAAWESGNEVALGRLDKALKLLDKDPERIASGKGFVEYLNAAGVWGVVTPPPSMMHVLLNKPEMYVDLLNGGYHGTRTEKGTQEAARAGLDGTVEMRNLLAGEAPHPWAVALHHLWGILSRMLAPLDQEAMWLRLITHKPVLDAIQSSIDGTFTLTPEQWEARVKQARIETEATSQKRGNSATANANAFYAHLANWNGNWDKVADIYASKSAAEMGRRFWKLNLGKVGIRNKVQRFIGLTFGVPGVILDRWKFVELWLPTMMQKAGVTRPSEYFAYSGGLTPEDPLGVYGVLGGLENDNNGLSLALYEGLEKVMQKAIDASPLLQQHMGQHQNPGGMHWFGWNAIKNESVGHSSLDLTKQIIQIQKQGSSVNAETIQQLIASGTFYTEGLAGAKSITRFAIENGVPVVTTRSRDADGQLGGLSGSAGGRADGQGGSGETTAQQEVTLNQSVFPETQRTPLLAIHNISGRNILNAAELGGLPVPSIGVTRPDAVYTGFGEISLIGTKDLADPRRNPVFNADAYTVRFPQPEYGKMKQAAANKIIKPLLPFQKLFNDYTPGEVWQRLVERGDVASAIDKLSRSEAAKAAFLDSKGITVEPVMYEPAMNYGWSNSDTLKEYLTPERMKQAMAGDENIRRELVPVVEAAIRKDVQKKNLDPEDAEHLVNRFKKNALSTDGGVGFNILHRIETDWSRADKKQVDLGSTRDVLNEALKGREAEFEQWVQGMILAEAGEPKLTIGRKKVPFTLENIVDYMTSSSVKGVESTMTFGEGKARAMSAAKIADIEEMRNRAQSEIGTKEEVDAAREKASKLLADYRTKAAEHYGYADTWSAFDDSMKALAKWAKGARTTANLQKALKAVGFKSVPQDVLELGVEAGKAFLNAPVPYFESKPQRSVALSEFKAAVVPSDTRQEVRQVLADAGVQVFDYTPYDDASRRAVVAQASQETQTLFQNEKNARGSISFNPAQRGAPRREFTIRMLSSANASTFMHEAAHFYLEVFNDLASAPDAPQALREDWNRISKWLGLQAGVPITVDQHETFARGFERYLMEGKAPAEEVRGFFASMRTWLVRIYRDLMNLNVDISDDIRGVFDRMVATDVEIEAAQAREKVEPMFGTKPDGMDEAAWERYRKAVESASLQARERLQTELEREMLKAKSDERKAEIARVTQTVRSELAATREHIALAILRSGKMPDDEPIPEPLMPMKLDRDSLLSAGFDKDTMDALRKLGVYRVEEGVSVDVAAEVLGFGSADELVQALVSTPSFDKAVKEETKRRVDASHPSIMEDSKEIKRAASDAVRNDKRDEVIAVEVEELQRLIRADKQAAGRVADLAPAPLGAIARRILRSGPEQANAARILLDNSKVTVDFIKAMATKVAQEQLQGMKLRDIRPSLYLAAARAAGARASRLAAAGDFQGALGQKESELLNHILYRESRDMQKVAQKQQRYLLRMTEDAARERLGKANPSYREQVDGILERFNFVPIPLSQVDRRTRLAEWISAQEAKGLTVDIDETVRDEAFRKDFREMTAIELTAVWEAVKQIDHLAKTTTRLLTLQDEREFRAVVQDLVAQITANTKAKPRGFGSKTSGEKIAEGWDSFFAAHRKLASLVREMDGFVDAGPVYNAIMAPINDAGDNEAVETEKATEAIQKLFKVFEKDELKRMTRKQVVRGATKNFNLSREDVLSIALNWGNEDNRQKLVDGYNGLTEQDVIAILDTMTEKEWKFVQSVWDYIDSFWPRIRDKQERVYGIPPDKIEPTPVVTKFGVFKGGYYPLKYAGARAEGESDADAAKMMMRGAVTSSTTRRGHTKERVAGVERPVRLDLGVLTEHVTQVVHDLTHHEMLVDVNRILRNRSVMEAIEEHYGEPVYRQLRKALEAIAVGNTNSEDRFTRALGHIRTGASVAGLGFNLMTSMLQAFGLTNAIPRVGAVNMAKAVGRWIGSSKDMEDSIAWIYERSDMMRLRGKTMNRELNEIRNTVDPKFQTALMDSYFYLIQKGQMLADVPTWLGAYHKAMDAKSTEEEAVRIADQTVIDTQGGGMVKDLANVQRGGPLLKMWTTFYSYFNALWNLNVETVKRTNFKSPTDMGRMMVDLLILNSLPVAIQYALVTAMRGGAGGDDEEWYKALAKQQMSYLLAQLVFVRELGGIMDGRNYEGPAGGRFFAESYKLAKQVEQGELDRGFWVSANKVGGILFHYPAVQAQRTVEGMKSLWEGKTSNPAVLIVGPSREER